MLNPQSVTLFLSTLTLAVNVLCFIGFALITAGKISGRIARVHAHPTVILLRKNARIMAFTVALTAMLGSLYFSEIALYEPCKLCWIQRIFMYPLPFLFGCAIVINDRKYIRLYSAVLSAAGAIVALYHYYLQRGGSEFIPCNIVGYSVSCAKVFVMPYGYITIPFMSLSAFILIIALMMIYKPAA